VQEKKTTTTTTQLHIIKAKLKSWQQKKKTTTEKQRKRKENWQVNGECGTDETGAFKRPGRAAFGQACSTSNSIPQHVDPT